MEINTVLSAVLIAVFIVVGVALVFFVIELVKTMRKVQGTINDLGPTLEHVEAITGELETTMSKVNPMLGNVQTMTGDLIPAVQKIDPIMDRAILTVDSLNLEMMRVDQILENVSEITDSASSAAGAVDNITNAPVKAVNNVASRIKTRLGGKSASTESAQLAEQRVAVAQALKDYEKAEEKAAKTTEPEAPALAPEPAPEPVVEPAPAPAPAPEPAIAESADDAPKTYVKFEEGVEPVIDPKVIAESPFFDDKPDAE